MTQLYLIRHGQTDWNLEGRVQGQTDVPLSRIGELQAEELAERLGDLQLSAIISSPLARTRQTAEPLALRHGLAVRFDTRLMEQDWGRYEGLRWRDAAEEFPDAEERMLRDPLNTAPPEGETLKEVAERMRAALSDVVQIGGSVAVVSHGGALRAGLHALLGTGLSTALRYHFDNASVSLVETDPQRGVIVHYINRIGSVA